MNPLRTAAALGVVGLLAFGVTGAMAADSISIQVGNDPTEEVPLPISVTWSSGSSQYVFVTVKPAGGQGCGANYDADDPNSSDVITASGASGTRSQNWTFNDPGAFTLCGYLQHGGSDTTPLAVTGPVAVNVRSATASVAISVPPRVDQGKPFSMSFAVVAELSRQLFVTIQPAGGRGCEATYALNDPQSSDVLTTNVQGSQTSNATWTASDTRGTYLLCTYVQERSNDPSPEATASTQFLVGPDPCVSAKRAVKSAKRTVRITEAAVTRYRRLWKRYATRGSHALAVLYHSRYHSAVRRRAKARGRLVNKQAAVKTACGQ
jgi:hypothetical protein